jgi:hypothetical protein
MLLLAASTLPIPRGPFEPVCSFVAARFEVRNSRIHRATANATARLKAKKLVREERRKSPSRMGVQSSVLARKQVAPPLALNYRRLARENNTALRVFIG